MPLQLSTQSFGPTALASAPPGSSPSHTEFTVTFSGGPFCILGLYVEPVTSAGDPAGKAQIALSRINGSGVYPSGV
jgi:hypothetical protein